MTLHVARSLLYMPASWRKVSTSSPHFGAGPSGLQKS
jgi:hypothetical protein